MCSSTRSLSCQGIEKFQKHDFYMRSVICGFYEDTFGDTFILVMTYSTVFTSSFGPAINSEIVLYPEEATV